MTHGVLIQNRVQASDIDALNRSAVCASAVDNGNIVILTGKSTTADESEMWTAVVPTTSAGLTGVWMAASPEVVVTVSGSQQFKGIDPDVRNFTNLATKPFSVFKPKVGDIITLTADNFSGAKGGSDTHANATNSTGGLVLVWGTSQTASVFSVKLLATTYISIADGSIGTQRVTAYQMEIVGE